MKNHGTSSSSVQVTKTPVASSQRRRALGDISNKKEQNVFQDNPKNGFDNKSTTTNHHSNRFPSARKDPYSPQQTKKKQQFKTPSNLPKPTNTSIPSFAKRNNAFISRIPSPKSSSVQTTRTENSLIVRTPLLPTVASKPRVEPVLPQSKPIQPFQASLEDKKAEELLNELLQLNVGEESVDDIELPAGRTWQQQLELDEKEDEDDPQALLELSFETPLTMWEDWKQSVRQEIAKANQERDLELAQQDDAALEERIRKVMEQDGKDRTILQ